MLNFLRTTISTFSVKNTIGKIFITEQNIELIMSKPKEDQKDGNKFIQNAKNGERNLKIIVCRSREEKGEENNEDTKH